MRREVFDPSYCGMITSLNKASMLKYLVTIPSCEYKYVRYLTEPSTQFDSHSLTRLELWYDFQALFDGAVRWDHKITGEWGLFS